MKIKDDYQIQEVMGEHLLIRQGHQTNDLTQMISLNDTALVLWNEFKGKEFSEPDIIRYLLNRYEVTEETAAADTHKWVEKLKKCQAIDA